MRHPCRRTDLLLGGLPVKDATEYIGATFCTVGTGASDESRYDGKEIAANAIHCTPSYALYLSGLCKEKQNMEPSKLGFKKLVVGAQPGGGVPAMNEDSRRISRPCQ